MLVSRGWKHSGSQYWLYDRFQANNVMEKLKRFDVLSDTPRVWNTVVYECQQKLFKAYFFHKVTKPNHHIKIPLVLVHIKVSTAD